MSISVIIPTYNGAHKIINALASLEDQTLVPDEVIVVVDGSTDDTVERLKQRAFNFPSFQIIEQKNGGRSKSRNRGALEAAGSLLIFLDDDMVAGKELVAIHHKHNLNHPGSILTGSQLTPHSENDFENFKASLSRRWENDLNADHNKPLPLKHVFLTAANFSVSKNVFNALNGFDERLTDGEDFDLAFRAVKNNIELYFDNHAEAYHHESITCRQSIIRNRCYHDAGITLAKIEPELYAPVFGDRLKNSRTLKDYLFLPFCFSFWVNSVDSNFWTWLPQNIRHKLYDWVLTANSTKFPHLLTLRK